MIVRSWPGWSRSKNPPRVRINVSHGCGLTVPQVDSDHLTQEYIKSVSNLVHINSSGDVWVNGSNQPRMSCYGIDLVEGARDHGLARYKVSRCGSKIRVKLSAGAEQGL